MKKPSIQPLFLCIVFALLLTTVVWLSDASSKHVEANSGSRAAQMTQTRSFDGRPPVVVPAAAFVADGFMPDSVFFPFGGGYFQGTSDNYGCMTAPVYLPEHVTITDMFVSVYDNDATRSIGVILRRLDNFTGAVNTMASVSTTASDAFPGITILNDDTIDTPETITPDYSYFVTTCLGSANIRIYSMRLYYDQYLYLPIVLK